MSEPVSMPPIRNRRKLNPTRQQFIWRAVTTAIDIPKQFRRHAVRRLTREPKLIWTRNRKIAQQIEKMGQQAGGQPWVWPIPFRTLRLADVQHWLNHLGTCRPLLFPRFAQRPKKELKISFLFIFIYFPVFPCVFCDGGYRTATGALWKWITCSTVPPLRILGP